MAKDENQQLEDARTTSSQAGARRDNSAPVGSGAPCGSENSQLTYDDKVTTEQSITVPNAIKNESITSHRKLLWQVKGIVQSRRKETDQGDFSETASSAPPKYHRRKKEEEEEWADDEDTDQQGRRRRGGFPHPLEESDDSNDSDADGQEIRKDTSRHAGGGGGDVGYADDERRLVNNVSPEDAVIAITRARSINMLTKIPPPRRSKENVRKSKAQAKQEYFSMRTQINALSSDGADSDYSASLGPSVHRHMQEVDMGAGRVVFSASPVEKPPRSISSSESDVTTEKKSPESSNNRSYPIGAKRKNQVAARRAAVAGAARSPKTPNSGSQEPDSKGEPDSNAAESVTLQVPTKPQRPPPPSNVVAVDADCETGSRPHMEDALVALRDFNGVDREMYVGDFQPLSFFAIYDGHGGSEASKFAQRQLHMMLLRELQATKGADPAQTMKDVITLLDTVFVKTYLARKNAARAAAAQKVGERPLPSLSLPRMRSNAPAPQSPRIDGPVSNRGTSRNGMSKRCTEQVFRPQGSSPSPSKSGLSDASGSVNGSAPVVSCAKDEPASTMSEVELATPGTTVLCCLVSQEKVYCAWLGDSEAWLFRAGEPVQLVDCHLPMRDDELRRITESGGFVLRQNFPLKSKIIGRVQGQLCLSRSLGDYHLRRYGVTAEADSVEVAFDGTEEFIVMGSDGLWDVLEPREVYEIVISYLVRLQKRRQKAEDLLPSPQPSRDYDTGADYASADTSSWPSLRRRVQQTQPAPTKGVSPVYGTARILIRQALAKRSADNISVVVVFFPGSKIQPVAQPAALPAALVSSSGFFRRVRVRQIASGVGRMFKPSDLRKKDDK